MEWVESEFHSAKVLLSFYSDQFNKINITTETIQKNSIIINDNDDNTFQKEIENKYFPKKSKWMI